MGLLFWRKPPSPPLRDCWVKAREKRLAFLPDESLVPNKPYDDKARLQCVRAIVDDQPDWDYAISQDVARDNAIYAAAYYGLTQPFTANQIELIDFLSQSYAGRKICVYAWGIFTDIMYKHGHGHAAL